MAITDKEAPEFLITMIFPPQKSSPGVAFEVGALRQLIPLLQQIQPRQIFLVIDETAYRLSEAELQLGNVWQSYQISRFTGFAPNPKFEDILRGLAICAANPPDLIVAFGGGTAIDLAKLIGILSVHTSPPEQVIRGAVPITQAGPPLIAIPTTAGTGSEATQFAVAYIAGEKFSVAHPSLLPRWSLIDPVLTYSLPPGLTAATGLDAFCQAIESIWAVDATAGSLVDATHALLTACEHLSNAVNAPTPAARLGMAEASHFAGRAINISKTTAAHALSYRLTSAYGIPHGIAVALTISPLLAYNAQVTAADCQDPRGAADVQARIEQLIQLLGAQDVAEACRKIEQTIAECGCPVSLAEAGITEESELRQLVASVNAQRMSNNPRRLDPEALLTLLQRSTAPAVSKTSPPTAPHFLASPKVPTAL